MLRTNVYRAAGLVFLLACIVSLFAGVIPDTPGLPDEDASSITLSWGRFTATVRPDGRYTITTQPQRATDPRWRFSGTTGALLTDLAQGAGQDALGPYREIRFRHFDSGPRESAIRISFDQPVVTFISKCLDACPNRAFFPALDSYPAGLHQSSFYGMFGAHGFSTHAPDSPWLYFDNTGASFVISPAARFGVAALTLGPGNQIRAGVNSGIDTLPKDYATQTVLVVENGINRALDVWGRTLTTLSGKPRPANDADVVLEKLGYWTDNGATYYYKFEPNLGYEGTLLSVRDEWRKKGVGLGYLQLDSWWYPKGPESTWDKYLRGIAEYTADRSLFPRGLSDFQQRLGLPLVTHARWIDETSPYRRRYQFSNNVSIDPLYWDDRAAYLRQSGVVVYEQDWMGTQANAALSLTARTAYLSNMDRAARNEGINIQYCMPLPRHFLHSTMFNAVTTIRTSQDRFGPERWDEFLYGSRFASAVGLWPWSDVFMSSESDNLLISTLSAGPVGVGDKIGNLNAANLLRAARPDGVIVKPDRPLTPTDETFLADASGQGTPMVAATFTEFERYRAAYVLAYKRGSLTTAQFTPARLGFSGDVLVYDALHGLSEIHDASDLIHLPVESGLAYRIVVPITGSGLALIGDPGHFVTLGKKRIADVRDGIGLHATVLFAEGEQSRRVCGYSRMPPSITASIGNLRNLRYTEDSGLFCADITPDSTQRAEIHLTNRTRRTR